MSSLTHEFTGMYVFNFLIGGIKRKIHIFNLMLNLLIPPIKKVENSYARQVVSYRRHCDMSTLWLMKSGLKPLQDPCDERAIGLK